MNTDDPTQTTQSFADQAGNAADTAGRYVKRAYDESRDEAEDAVEAGVNCARNNLASGIATAFIGGLIIGFALARRQRPSFQKQYIHEPMEQAQEMAAALLAPLARALRDQYGNARSAAHDAADRVSDLHLDAEPLLKRTRDLGKRLKFW